jgi:MFS family permease
MCAAVGLGSVVSGNVALLIAAQGAAVVGMSFTWATLEALVSGGEDRRGLQRMVGLYNVVWAATAAIGYFIGGWMLDKLGLSSFFYVPMTLFGAQFLLTLWLERRAGRLVAGPSPTEPAEGIGAEIPETEDHPHLAANPKAFLQMAWLANPLAYVALNTTIAVMPGLAANLGLTTTQAGFCGSVWTFARVGAFWLFWLWPGWHYRFRYLLTAYLLLVISFALMLTLPNLAVLVTAQLFFGSALGLIYYSSLFYAMDLSDAKGEHGGLHEAAIGLGNFGGPAVGAVSLWLWPNYANSGALAVTGLLVLGLGGLVGIWKWGRRGRAGAK